MQSHPYSALPPEAFWRKSIAEISPADVDPVVRAAFTITRTDRVATAGSCFAQHIARYLRDHDFNYYTTEIAHPLVSKEMAQSYNYGTFTARFGNLYTTRQLLQLHQRVYGEFQPADDIWEAADGSFIDPFRPQIQPGGFSSRAEYDADRAQHFASVREAFEKLDVFIFTLGLTECWRSNVDGAVYPLCPGVAGGTYDPAVHEFLNLTVDDVAADMLQVIDRIRARNPKAKVILTVSPVPLIATAGDKHVLVATTYSKSVLRVAADQIARARPSVAYFPSYEVITGSYTRGRYFAPDLRSVTEEGVAHVMRLFLKHYTGTIVADAAQASRAAEARNDNDAHIAEMAHLVEVSCDEEALDRGVRQAGA